MANKNELFKDLDVSNKVSRNGFDLSHGVKFTAKAGELLPVLNFGLIPGDSVRIHLDHFTRTAPVNTAAFTQIREYFDFFWVPYRVLWKNAPQVLTQNTKNPQIASSATSNRIIGQDMPKMNFALVYNQPNDNSWSVGEGYIRKLSKYKNEFNFNRGALAIKLLNHLGYCYVPESLASLYEADEGEHGLAMRPMVSILPLLAYNKIYYDFYRNTQWEDNQPYNYNFDYSDSSALWAVSANNNETFWSNPTMFDLRYSNYPKDLFFGLIPDAQYGDAAVVPVDYSEESITDAAIVGLVNNQLEPIYVQSTGESLSHITYGDSFGSGFNYTGQLYTAINTLKGQFSILEERKAKALQKYKEIIGSGQLTYSDIIRKIFNENASELLDNECKYLGGSSSEINISEVVNSNLADGNEALIKGKGTGSQKGEYIEFSSKAEYGLIMCIYHCQPVIDYALNAFSFDSLRTEADDWANPIYDRLGFQPLPVYYLDNTTGLNTFDDITLGYTTRYFDYKTMPDRTLGDFRNTLKSWIAPVSFDYLQDYYEANNKRFEINYTFFKVNPHILDTVFNPVNDNISSDQFWVSANFQINAVRPLDYIGVPY